MLTLIRWIAIYPVDSVIQPLNNRGLVDRFIHPSINWDQVEEYESDSDDSDNDVDIESEELVFGKPIMTIMKIMTIIMTIMTRFEQGLKFRRAKW